MGKDWRLLFKGFIPETEPAEGLRKKALECFDVYGVYPDSIQKMGATVFFIAKEEGVKKLVLFSSDEYFSLFDGEEETVGDKEAKACGLNHENLRQLRLLFPYICPVPCGSRRFSFGMGDRLGVATPGHIRAVKGLPVFPVFAQQSMRELTLTGRTYEGVLDDASWAVFQEGYTEGFGADADHLKTKEQVEAALRDGYTMITLDCSDHIDNRCFSLDDDALASRYEELPGEQRRQMEAYYLAGAFPIGDCPEIVFRRQDLVRLALVYGRALDFMAQIYRDVIQKNGKEVDFEISIDETTVPTSPEAHFFIASELAKRRVKACSIAPRFCGEFQKGIDYIGDVTQFESELMAHAKIAEYFGHRLSIHSGSDKFSVFPIIGKYTRLNVHVKTAGTSWLEAVRLIAAKNPALYRRMHSFALAKLDEAKKHYHIGAQPERIPPLDTLQDMDLPALMEQNDARQVLHVNYGALLRERESGGEYAFRDGIYNTLSQHEDAYCKYLVRHMRRHLALLGVCEQ